VRVVSPLARALASELVVLLRADRQLRDELRAALELADDELLPIARAAEIAHVSAATVSRWIRAGGLAATGTGKSTRVARSDLVAFLQRGGRRVVDVDPERLAEFEEAGR
jgi:excisionase family DNA binding protein